MIDKFENMDWMRDHFKAIVARHVRAAAVSARTVKILQRDLFKVHKAAKRKASHKAVASSVAQKSRWYDSRFVSGQIRKRGQTG